MLIRKKILILVDWFVPGFKAGGPIRSCVNICNTLKNDYDIYVLTTDTDHGEIIPYENIITDDWVFVETLGIHIYYAQRKKISIKQIATQITFINADYIYLNHLFSPYFSVYPLWLKLSGKMKNKVIVAPRGALYDSALSLKIYKKKPLLHIYKWLGLQQKIIFHATNIREQQAITQYFKGSTSIIADNLPASNQPSFTGHFKESGKLKCIFIARIVPIKNLLYLLEILQSLQQEILLTIIGPVEDELYWQACKNIIKSMPEHIVVNYVGPKQNEELPYLIQQHHLFILATTGENFGHSIFEALLNGRPILISDQTPWLNLQELNAGWDIPLDRPEKFAEKIVTMAMYDQIEFDKIAGGAWQFANNFINNSAAKQQYYKMFK